MQKIDDSHPFSILVACYHVLLEEEQDYVICPSCGKIIEKNLPDDPYEQELIDDYEKKLKKSTTMLLYSFILFCLGLSGLYLTQFIGDKTLALSKDYAHLLTFVSSSTSNTFSRGSNPWMMFTLFPFLTFALCLGWGEKGRRNLLVSLKLERFYSFISSWIVQLLYWALVSGLIFSIFMPFIQDDAKYVVSRIVARGDELTTVQQLEVAQLFIQTIHLSMAIFAIELLLYQLLVTAKTRRIKQINEAYLAGEEPWE